MVSHYVIPEGCDLKDAAIFAYGGPLGPEKNTIQKFLDLDSEIDSDAH